MENVGAEEGLADAGHKYLSKIFNDEWMRENGFLENSPGLGTVRDLFAGRDKRPLVTATPNATLRDVIGELKARGISQLPVVEHGKLLGIVAEVDLLRVLVSGGKTLDAPIRDLVESDYASVTPNTKLELLQGVLAEARVAIVEDGDNLVGIVTKIDVIDFLARQSQPGTRPPGA